MGSAKVFLTSYRAGRRLNVCAHTLRRYVRLGVLQGHFERGQWRFPEVDVEFLRRYGPPHQSAKAAAGLLGIGLGRLRQLTREGVVPAIRAGNGHVYARDELLALRDKIHRRRKVRRPSRSQPAKVRAYAMSWRRAKAAVR